MILHGSEKNHLSERHHLAEDQPDVDHFDIGGGRQYLHVADEDGGHHQHGGQVHTQGCLKEKGLEEGGGKCDHHEEGEIESSTVSNFAPPHESRFRKFNFSA